jgi:hypothetical protein
MVTLFVALKGGRLNFISEALNTALLAVPVPCFEVADALAFA